MVRGVVCSSIVSSTGGAESLVRSSPNSRALMRSFSDTRLAWHAMLEATHLPTDPSKILPELLVDWVSAGSMSKQTTLIQAAEASMPQVDHSGDKTSVRRQNTTSL